MTIDLDTARATLQEYRLKVVRQLEELGAGESGDLRPDLDIEEGFADAAAATAERTEILGIVENLNSQLRDIDLAMARIEEGKYGTCAECGKPISEARLEARPESSFCVDCAADR